MSAFISHGVNARRPGRLRGIRPLEANRGARLPADTVQRHLMFAQGLEPHGSSSLYDDLAGGRRLELEALHGTVVRLGREHEVEVPASQAVYAILKPWEGGTTFRVSPDADTSGRGFNGPDGTDDGITPAPETRGSG